MHGGSGGSGVGAHRLTRICAARRGRLRLFSSPSLSFGGRPRPGGSIEMIGGRFSCSGPWADGVNSLMRRGTSARWARRRRLRLRLPNMPDLWDADGLLIAGMDSKALCSLGWDALRHLQAQPREGPDELGLGKLTLPKLRSFIRMNQRALKKLLAIMGKQMPNQLGAFFGD